MRGYHSENEAFNRKKLNFLRRFLLKSDLQTKLERVQISDICADI